MTGRPRTTLRDLEADSIRSFVEYHAHLLTGNVLDYGAGRQPYRKIVEAVGAHYVPYDRMAYPASTVTTDVGYDSPLADLNVWDAILCTQVIQYVSEPMALLRDFEWALKVGGALVMTGPTNWPVIEIADLHRHTVPGITLMLDRAKFKVDVVFAREHVGFEGEQWAIGWAAVARAR